MSTELELTRDFWKDHETPLDEIHLNFMTGKILDNSNEILNNSSKINDLKSTKQDTIQGKSNDMVYFDSTGKIASSGISKDSVVTESKLTTELDTKANKVNNPINGRLVSLDSNGNLITSDKAAADVITDVKTINGESILGTGNIVIEGGSGSGVGETTPEDGEIFNDYENNKALTPFSHSEGVQTIAGTYAFNIIQAISGDNTYILDSVEGLEIGDVISIKWSNSYINCAKISYIHQESNTVAVDKFITNSDTQSPRKLFVIAKPTIGTEPFDEGAHAEGYDSQAVLYGAHAEGGETKALGRYAHAEGRDTQAGYSAHSEGRGTRALGEMSHAEGGYTESLGHYSHAEGYKTQALSIGSGLGASHAEGGETIADGQRSHAEGSKSKAYGVASHSEGLLTTASGQAAHAEGEQSTAGGQATHAEGFNTFAQQSAAHSEGWGTSATGMYSHSEGYGTEATNTSAHAEGYVTKAYGIRSHSEGIATKAEGDNSHAEGNQTTASGQSSHSEGELSDSTALASHAEGYDTTASGAASHAEGTRTVASNIRAHAEGGETLASGEMSHAEGEGTTASGYVSHAEGKKTVASGRYSHSSGLGTKATGEAQTVVGKYNRKNDEALFVVGNGTSDLDTDRNNAFVVREDGRCQIQTPPEEPMDVVNKQFLDNSLNAVKIGPASASVIGGVRVWVEDNGYGGYTLNISTIEV